jgi:translation elongation factor EF-Tu-like GTPase
MSAVSSNAYIEALIELLPSEKGGRKTPIMSGYRCNCWLGRMEDGRRTYNDATFVIVDSERIEPGGRGVARVHPHLPRDWSDLGPGSTFELCEGPRTIGTATVSKSLPRPPHRYHDLTGPAFGKGIRGHPNRRD